MFKAGHILTIPFPFSDRAKAKQRPVLVLSEPDAYGDFICLAITSRERPLNTVPLSNKNMVEGALPHLSWVMTDKVFTLNASLVNKAVGMVSDALLGPVLLELCRKIGCKSFENATTP